MPIPFPSIRSRRNWSIDRSESEIGIDPRWVSKINGDTKIRKKKKKEKKEEKREVLRWWPISPPGDKNFIVEGLIFFSTRCNFESWLRKEERERKGMAMCQLQHRYSIFFRSLFPLVLLICMTFAPFLFVPPLLPCLSSSFSRSLLEIPFFQLRNNAIARNTDSQFLYVTQRELSLFRAAFSDRDSSIHSPASPDLLTKQDESISISISFLRLYSYKEAV